MLTSINHNYLAGQAAVQMKHVSSADLLRTAFDQNIGRMANSVIVYNHLFHRCFKTIKHATIIVGWGALPSVLTIMVNSLSCK